MTSATPLARPGADDATIIAPGIRHPIWLVRHAPTSWTGNRWCGRADPPLSREGRAIAGGLAAAIQAAFANDEPRPTIRSSPARRARATAEAIARLTGTPIAIDDDLLEVHVGVAEGLTWAELSGRYPDLAAEIAAGRRVDWPGGETMAAVEERARRASIRISAGAETNRVIVVSHGALLHAVVAALAGTPGTHFFAPAGILRLVPAAPR
jgi:probable phosphoglycerate mutase